jgi:hypothetical protein
MVSGVSRSGLVIGSGGGVSGRAVARMYIRAPVTGIVSMKSAASGASA